MVPRQTVYKRKLKGILTLFFFSFLLFLGVFALSMGVWFVFHRGAVPLVSPLPQAAAEVKSANVGNTIAALCNKYALSCTHIVVEGNTATFFVDTDEQVIVSLQKDLPTQIASLQLTIAHLTIEGKRFKQLDFRFDKPVLTF